MTHFKEKAKKKEKKTKPETMEDLVDSGPHALKCVELLLDESTIMMSR